MASKPPNTTIIRTTLPRLPLPPQSTWPHLQTARLLLRPLTASDDAEAYYVLRSDATFMSESTLGKPDSCISETREALSSLSDPERENFLFGIFVADTGELIGDGGIHTIRHGGMGWPEIGYKLAPAHWGKGYATEAMRAVLEAWWALPREEGEEVWVKVHGDTIELLPSAIETQTHDDGETGEEKGESKGKGRSKGFARERMSAEIATYNQGSRNVLQKLGFEHYGTWEEPDTQLHRLGQPLEMGHYVLSSPK
ncbi:acetyltransferase domain-containing protein [Xylaria arbuscula]|nr:acetyltransferase domain-containing protein [Xylaria arbuscula]